MNYLSPELAVQVLKELPVDKQDQVGIFLAKVKELDASEVDRLEARIKSKSDFYRAVRTRFRNCLITR